MKKTIQVTILFLFGYLSVLGQTKETKEADNFFKNLSYERASVAYSKLAEKEATEHVLKMLGDSYYFNVKMQEASKTYAMLFAKYTPEDTEYLFKYAQSLRSIGKFEDSNIWMRKFHEANKKDTRGLSFTDKDSTLKTLQNTKPGYTVTNLRSINSVNSDFGVTEYGNTILFSSPRERSVFINRNHTRNDKDFLDIYKVRKENISTSADFISDVRPMFTNEVNSKLHESSITFSPDRKTMYFTRNNLVKGNYGKDKEGYNNLKILKAEWVKDKWDNIIELPFCSDEYSVGHPSMSKDGNRLYFASDMPGGLGKTDLYYVDLKIGGSYGRPVNLGTTVNTEGREMFPFIADDEVLYFSSDGHFGIGALDVFSTKEENNEFTTPVNLRAPINTQLDDFAFSINPSTKKGYLSSNRVGGVGDDDIYAIEQLEQEAPKVVCMQTVNGVVRDTKFKNPLSDAALVLKNAKGDVLQNAIANNLGEFSFALPCNQQYTVTASKEYYDSGTDTFVATGTKTVLLDLNFSLPIAKEFVYNERNELVIKIQPIYFDYNKSNIRLDAQRQLDIVAAVMNKFGKIKVRGSSHTDARGKAAYNEKLSTRRANATVAYIKSKGIQADRIMAKGFGETRLTNACLDNDTHTNQVKCSSEEHQNNRRTEFVIIEM